MFWGVMRWLSFFAILFYIGLLCTPQSFAVHDVRLSPLADTQLQALLPGLPTHTVDNAQNNDDDPPVLPSTLIPNVLKRVNCNVIAYSRVVSNFPVFSHYRVRAPPAFFSL